MALPAIVVDGCAPGSGLFTVIGRSGRVGWDERLAGTDEASALGAEGGSGPLVAGRPGGHDDLAVAADREGSVGRKFELPALGVEPVVVV